MLEEEGEEERRGENRYQHNQPHPSACMDIHLQQLLNE